ncbi:MAPEG family protein [Sphingomonas sp.]|jgi:hypothetical protein|uniref:MAPEG family protein n=1 Tax=Sphingomonas sp. TaxID=28214 RepID=UPI002ED9E6AB
MVVLNIIWPTFALVLLIFAVWATMFVQRSRYMRQNPPAASDFADGEAALRYFRPVEMPANNLANLFEMPVLYFALVPLLIVTHQTNLTQIALAWAFVALRAAHSVIHIGPKKVQQRFLAYLASCAVLLAMWIGYFIDIASAAQAYAAAMRSVG